MALLKARHGVVEGAAWHGWGPDIPPTRLTAPANIFMIHELPASPPRGRLRQAT